MSIIMRQKAYFRADGPGSWVVGLVVSGLVGHRNLVTKCYPLSALINLMVRRK